MKIPQLYGITDLVALQNLVALILLSDDRLKNVPVLPEFKLYMESDLMVDALWTLPRSAFTVGPDGVTVNTQVNSGKVGPVGAGLLVEMVEGSLQYPDEPGPSINWEVNVVALEERNTNLTAGVGIGITAEQLVQVVLDILHILLIRDFGTFRAAPKPFAPAHDWMTMKPGINAYRASLLSLNNRNQSQRPPPVNITFNAGVCSLATAYGTADTIYYTQTPVPQDGSVVTNAPAPVKANTTAQVYAGPFPVVTGDVVSAAAYTAGTVQAPINTQTAP